ncbi:MAG: PIG-L deacetylase family protein [Bacteroidota bacterium]
MKLIKPGAEMFIPDGTALPEALSRTTMLAIAAHQDDIEIMAYDGILKCFGKSDAWFSAVVVTDGRGSPRDDLYAGYTDDRMRQVRKLEQKKAAFIGEYAAQFLLDFSSSEVKDPNDTNVVSELKEILANTKPEVVYTHNLADKHDTHVATALKTIRAIRELPVQDRPERLYGCEVWRDLDWVNDDEKVVFDLSSHQNLAVALMGVIDSQICGGKRYDLAIMGRRRANATFFASHGTDQATSLGYAIDLSPLIEEETDAAEFIDKYIQNFARDVAERIRRFV